MTGSLYLGSQLIERFTHSLANGITLFGIAHLIVGYCQLLKRIFVIVQLATARFGVAIDTTHHLDKSLHVLRVLLKRCLESTLIIREVIKGLLCFFQTSLPSACTNG